MNIYNFSTTLNTQSEQFLFELKYALNGINTEEILFILKCALFEAGKETAKKKIEAIKSVSKSINELFKRYNRDGYVNSLQIDYYKIKEFASKIPEEAQKIYNCFCNLSHEEQVEQVAVLLLTVSIFYISSGGIDLEGGLPDTDITIGGIGSHRNLFSHTILLGFGVEFGARAGIMIFEKIKTRLPADHSSYWDKAFDFINKHKELGVSAMWSGIGIHLLKDSGIFTGGVKPYVGIPGSIPISGHQSLFAANGIACEVISKTNK